MESENVPIYLPFRHICNREGLPEPSNKVNRLSTLFYHEYYKTVIRSQGLFRVAMITMTGIME